MGSNRVVGVGWDPNRWESGDLGVRKATKDFLGVSWSAEGYTTQTPDSLPHSVVLPKSLHFLSPHLPSGLWVWIGAQQIPFGVLCAQKTL